MKILLINTLYYPNFVGGAERSVQFLAEALVRFGHNVSVISMADQSGTHSETVNGVKVYYIGLKNFFWPFDGVTRRPVAKGLYHLRDTYNLAMSREVTRIITVERPDVVHTNNLAGFSVAVWDAVKRQNTPIVHTLRDYYLLCARSAMFRNGHNCEDRCTTCRLFGYPRSRASHLVDVVVGNSQFILRRHLQEEYFPNAGLKCVIHNAYEANESNRQPVSNGPLRLGYIGRLDPTKGVEYFLQEVMRLNSEHVTIQIAGRGTPDYESYLQETYSRANIRFLGFQQPDQFFGDIDLLVAPSLWHEPLPRTVFESFAHGVPVIGSNRGGTPELIDEGKTGHIFDPDLSGTLTSLITRIANDRSGLQQMQIACLEKAKQFMPAVIVNAYVKAYEAALMKAGRATGKA